MHPSICFTLLLFLSTIAFSDFGADAQEAEKIKIGNPVSVNVDYPPRVAIPIQFASDGYVGPYDPFDPKGVLAAQHRRAKINHDSNIQLMKSYIPPGMGNMIKKEGIKVAVKEGERFAVAHPVETADLVGIATRVKHLYHLGSAKLKKASKN